MALIKNLDDIKNLIPSPDYRLYGSNITEASSKEVIDNPLFAFTVYRKTKNVVGMFRVMFMLIKKFDKFHLMVTNYDRSHTTFTDYITITAPKDRKLSIDDWPFTVDNIGLRLDSTCYDRNMIYFGTKADDVNTLKKELKKEKETKIVTLEPVLV